MHTDVKPKTKVTATVTARKEPSLPGGIDWHVDYAPDPPGNGQQDGDKFKLKGLDPVAFNFRLVDDTSFKLAFAGTGAEAIFVAQGETCPNTQGDGGGEFIIEPNTSAKSADMIDLNSIKGPYSYQLNFTSNDGPKHFDPVLINRALN